MPNIGGQEYQHGLIDLAVNAGAAPISITSFKNLEYEDGAEKKGVNDATGEQVSFTIDPQKTNGSISMRLSEWRTLRSKLLQQNPGLGIGQIALDWTVTFGNSLDSLRTDELIGVMFQKDPLKSSDDQSALVVEIPLFVLKVKVEGQSFIEYPL